MRRRGAGTIYFTSVFSTPHFSPMTFSFQSLLLLAGLSVAFTACKDDDDDTPPATSPKTVEELPAGNLTTRTLTSDKVYLLKGAVTVPDGVTLTIQPGTIIKGDQTTNGSLVVRMGGRLMAEGTASAPIVFTSNKPAGSRAPGDWGGVVILGRAPVNFNGGAGNIEGFGTPIPFGGTNPADNSGSLKYIRIEYAGIALAPGNEINGLTLGGVGSGTTVEHIQVSNGGDDAFEFFGGTVNAKYLAANNTTDDMFDTDNGYSGKVQYFFGLSNPNNSDQAGASNGFESDNDANGSTNTPLTSGMFANGTVLGPQATTGATLPPGGNKYGQAVQIRRSSTLSIYNTVFAGWPKGLNIDGTNSQASFAAGDLKVMGTVIAGVPAGQELIGTGTATKFNESGLMNALMTDNSGLQLNSAAFTLTAPNAMPNSGSPLLSGGATLPTGFEPTTYRGAFNTTNWLAGWTNFNPQNTAY